MIRVQKDKNMEFWCFNRARDASLIKAEEMVWQGPFSWPCFEQTNKLAFLPDIEGVYLQTFEYKDGFILCSAGVTTSTRRRFSQHTRAFKKGEYTILDTEAAKRGERKEIWHGWGYARTHQEEFLQHKEFLLSAVEKHFCAYRLFVAEVADRRKRERIESAIMLSIYNSKELWNDMADTGMALRQRYNSEMPIEIKNRCAYKIYGLAEVLEV
ncbi:MAG: hypothetical protein H0V30_10225 [Chitinophagaceae bacterium]|nr:hypothetical protein [Chitinophagaceae bacterium]